MIESGRRRSRTGSIRLYLLLAVYLLVVTFPFWLLT